MNNGRLSDSLFCPMCIAAAFLNGAILRARAVEYAEGDAEVLAEATGIVKTFVLYVGGLFVLLAIGAASGLAVLLAAHRQMFKYTPSSRVGVMVLWGFMMCLFASAIVGIATGTGYGR